MDGRTDRTLPPRSEIISEKPDSQKTYSNWILTVNNPDESSEVALNKARQRGWKVEGQLEVGKEGTPHWQIFIHSQQRFSGIKAMFPTAHIEVCRNPEAVRNYVKKTDTRVGDLPSQNVSMTMNKVMMLIANNVWNVKTYITTPEEFDSEFWNSVNQILAQRPGMISLFVQPNYIRAWRYTRETWIELAQQEAENSLLQGEDSLHDHLNDYDYFVNCEIHEDDDIEIEWDEEQDCLYHSYKSKHPSDCFCGLRALSGGL